MKKHMVIFLCALALHHQTVFCMDQQYVAIEPCNITELTQTPPDLKARLRNKVAGIKDWITNHNKEILVGGMALAVVTAAALYYYASQSAPLHASSIDTFNTVTPTPPSVTTYTQELLAAADTCARVPAHCWVEPDQTVTNKFILYGPDGKKYDYKIPGCSRQDLSRLYDGYQACYNAISNYAHEHGLSDVQAKIATALEQAKNYWGDLKFYRGLKW